MTAPLQALAAMDVRAVGPDVSPQAVRWQIELVADSLHREGILAGQRVLVAPAGRSMWSTVACYLGVLTGGRTPALVRPRDESQLDSMARSSGFVALADATDVRTYPHATAERTGEALIVFTSGSTGQPKGVRYSGAGVIANLDATQSFLSLEPTDVLSIPLPMHYVYGLSTLNLAIRTGASVHLANYRLPPVGWLSEVAAVDATILAMIPQQARLLLRSKAFQQSTLPRLRAITLAGGSLDEASARMLGARFPGTQIFAMYGQAEAGPRISYLPPPELARRGVGVGRGIAGHTQMRLSHEPGRAVGEIEVQTASLALGYLDGSPVAVTADGWLATGDLARSDDDGYLYVVARAAPFYKPFGERTSFEEVLRVVVDYRAGLDVRFDIIDDDTLGESVRLHLTSSPPMNSTEVDHLTRLLQRKLGPARCPQEIVVHDSDRLAKAR